MENVCFAMIVTVWSTRIKRIYSAANSSGATITQPITGHINSKFGTVRLPIKNEKMSVNFKVSLQGPVEFVTL